MDATQVVIVVLIAAVLFVLFIVMKKKSRKDDPFQNKDMDLESLKEKVASSSIRSSLENNAELRALVKLFAINAAIDANKPDPRPKVEKMFSQEVETGIRLAMEQFKNHRHFLDLEKHFVREIVLDFLQEYEQFLKQLTEKEGKRIRTSPNSVKVLRICTRINEDLEQFQKVQTLKVLVGFISEGAEPSEAEYEFVTTVGETFNISQDELDQILPVRISDSDEK